MMTKSTLTVSDIVYVLDVLQQVQNLKCDATPAEIGTLNARAFAAANTLRVHSGINEVRVEVRREEA